MNFNFTAVAASLLFGAVSAHATTINLGAADGYAVFALSSFQYNGPGTINGNVAVGQSTNFSSPAVVNGTVYLNTNVSQQGNITPTGGFMTTSLSTAIQDAKNDQIMLDALTPTQSFGILGNNSSITGTGGLNVINTTSINMTNGTLTLSGTAKDIFVINVNGNFTTSNADMILANGVLASNIIFDVTGNTTITGGGGNNYYGTILDPNGSISVHDKILNGELIGNTISDTSGFTVNNVPFSAPDPPSVPEPATWTFLLTGIGLIGLGTLRRT